MAELVGMTFRHPRKSLVAAVLILAGWWTAPARAVHVEGDTIVITQEDLDALARSRATTPSATTKAPAAPGEGYTVRFEDCYAFPARDFIYWQWLETGALGVIAPVEDRINERQVEHRRLRVSRDWSAQLQRELDQVEDEIDELEQEREQTLLERIAQLELDAAPGGPATRELAILHMANTLIALEDGRGKHALQSAERAAKLLPNEALAHLLRGIALREVGRNDDARNALRNALRHASRLLLALIVLAEANEDALDYAEAARHWADAQRVDLELPRGLERWANRNRGRFPEGEASLRRAWSDYLTLRLRLARLRDFAHTFYLSHEKAGYTLVYDPSIGLPARPEYLGPLRELVGRYLEQGEGSVDRAEVERLFETMRRERDMEEFNRMLSTIADFVSTAERDVGRAIGHRPSDPPVLVLYNPNVWQTLVARRSTLAFYKPRARSISIYLEPVMDPADVKNTIYHEYGHYVTLDVAGPRGLPLWLAEGLAELLALESGYDRFADDPVLARWRAVWMREPVSRPWFHKGRESFDLADYYKGRRAVGLLVTRRGAGNMLAFLRALGDGADLDEAADDAFEMTYRELLTFLVKQLPTWTGPGN